MSEILNELSAEPRVSTRGRTFLAAKIAWEDGAFSLDCVMRDLSENGARLRLPPSRAVPTSFYLLEVRTGETWEVQVAWRRFPEVGVTFVRRCREDVEPNPAVRVLLQLRAEALNRSGVDRG